MVCWHHCDGVSLWQAPLLWLSADEGASDDNPERTAHNWYLTELFSLGAFLPQCFAALCPSFCLPVLVGCFLFFFHFSSFPFLLSSWMFLLLFLLCCMSFPFHLPLLRCLPDIYQGDETRKKFSKEFKFMLAKCLNKKPESRYVLWIWFGSECFLIFFVYVSN